MRTVLTAALAAACMCAAAAPASASPYAIDKLHDRENRIQDAVDQRRASTRVGDQLIRIKKSEERMRARHGSNLTRADFEVLNARLDALEGVRHRHRRGADHGRSGPHQITTTTTTVRR